MSEVPEHYVLKDLLPVAFRKYIVVRSSKASCLFNRFFTAVDVLVSMRKWTGYNILVDWSDPEYSDFNQNMFSKYFKLLNREKYAFSCSDIPHSISTKRFPDNITRDMLLVGSASVGDDYSMVVYDSYFEPSMITNSAERNSYLANTLNNKISPRWNYKKQAAGFYSDKFKGKKVIGVDLDSLHDESTDKCLSVIDDLICKNTDIRIFGSSFSGRKFDIFSTRYGARFKTRSQKSDERVDALIHSIILSQCDYLVGKDSSLKYLYAKFTGNNVSIDI